MFSIPSARMLIAAWSKTWTHSIIVGVIYILSSLSLKLYLTEDRFL